jgi:predicted nucleic acid-binding protein
MTTGSKPLLDSNILIYAANGDSPFYKKAVEVIRKYLHTGFFLSDLNLIEFFQVVTDGRKTPEPFSPKEAFTYIKKLVAVPEVHVLRTQTLAELLAIEAICEEMIELGIRRFEIYDYLIADCMRKNKVKMIITGNQGDFKKFGFIEVINPFAPDSPHSTNIP